MTSLTNQSNRLHKLKYASLAVAAAIAFVIPSAKADFVFTWVSTGGTDSAIGEFTMDNSLTSFISGSFKPEFSPSEFITAATITSSSVSASFESLPLGERTTATSSGTTGSFFTTFLDDGVAGGLGYWAEGPEVPDATATAPLLAVSAAALSFVSRRCKRASA